jgi:hypothetical protein
MSDPAAASRPSGAAGALPYDCDLILKGGITSGIVHPPAIAEIARDHRLHAVGRSSAGAIAAAGAAAAELGRESENGGFRRLARIPEELAEIDARGDTRLRRLFQPQPETRDLFDLVWQAHAARGRRRIAALVWRASTAAEAPRSWLLASFVAWLVALGLGVAAFAVAGPGSLIASVPLFLLLAVGCLAVNLAGRLRTLAAAAPAALSGNLHAFAAVPPRRRAPATSPSPTGSTRRCRSSPAVRPRTSP